MSDVFYLPAMGVVESPLAAAKGLGKGVGGLMQKSLVGLTHSAGRLTDTAGKGLMSLTSKEYGTSLRVCLCLSVCLSVYVCVSVSVSVSVCVCVSFGLSLGDSVSLWLSLSISQWICQVYARVLLLDLTSKCVQPLLPLPHLTIQHGREGNACAGPRNTAPPPPCPA